MYTEQLYFPLKPSNEQGYYNNAGNKGNNKNDIQQGIFTLIRLDFLLVICATVYGTHKLCANRA